MIEATVGRCVHYFPHVSESCRHFSLRPGAPLAAMIAYVHSDTLVNLVVFDANGNTNGRTSITLLQGDEPLHAAMGYCAWMPYQVGQAAKTEKLQAELDSKFPTRAGGDPNVYTGPMTAGETHAGRLAAPVTINEAAHGHE